MLGDGRLTKKVKKKFKLEIRKRNPDLRRLLGHAALAAKLGNNYSHNINNSIYEEQDCVTYGATEDELSERNVDGYGDRCD